MSDLTLIDLQADDLVLCDRHRLMSAVREAHARAQWGQGRTRWPAINVSLLPLWLAHAAEDLALRLDLPWAHAQVLSPLQERLLWERVIRQSLGDQAPWMFDLPALARSAAQADALCVLWQLQLPDQVAEETRQFQRWQQRFVQSCEREGWISPARRDWAVVQALAQAPAGTWRRPARVVWAHSLPQDDTTPPSALTRALEAALAAQGVPMHTLVLPHADTPAAPAWHTAQDPAHELRAVAHWAAQWHAAHPQARIGLALTDLPGRGQALADALQHALGDTPITPAATLRWSVQDGALLAQSPLVQAALLALRVLAQLMGHGGLPGRLEGELLARWWAHPLAHPLAERSARARLDALRRRQVRQPLSAAAWTEWLQTHWIDLPMPQAQQHWLAMCDWAQAQTARALPSAWARTLRERLPRVGWQGATDPAHGDAARAFDDLLDGLRSLDRVSAEIGAHELLALLGQLCQERRLPERAPQAPVQVLALSDLPGQTFDALWVLGLDDHSGPTPARPNPLLPAALQRQARCPQADAAAQTAQAQGLLDLAQRAAPVVHMSWPRQDGDSERQACELLQAVAKLAQPLPEQHSAWPALQAHDTVLRALGSALPPWLQTVQDDLAPPVAEDEVLRGGSALLRAQAICPAWAFHAYRLGGVELETPDSGPDARDRGILLHHALAQIWAQLRTQEALRQCDDAALDALCAQAAHDALVHALQSTHLPLGPRGQSLEQQRLQRLLRQWLTLEAERPQGFEVLSTEQDAQVQIRRLSMRLQIDRLDRLDDGRLLVIDYKTGSAPDLAQWAGDRPTEPQLPIYATLVQHPAGLVAGVGLGMAKLDDCKWSGLGSDKDLLPGITHLDAPRARRLWPTQDHPDWASVLQHWQARLHALADEILQGHAAVQVHDPKQLMYCPVHALLRLPERERLWALQRPGLESTPRSAGPTA